MFGKFFGEKAASAVPEVQASRTMGRRQILQLGLSAVVGLGSDRLVSALRQERNRQEVIHRPQHFARPLRSLQEGRHEKIHINPHEPTCNRLREAGVFPREHQWAITADAEAFHALGSIFIESPDTKELLQQTEISMLVPAAGVLLSPLDMVFPLAEASTNLERLRLTLTDVDQETYDVFDAYLRMMVAACDNTSDLTTRIEPHPELAEDRDSRPAKKSMTFTYKTGDGRSVSVTVEYELQMSGSHYLRASSAAEADIVILHDLDRTGDFPLTREGGDMYTLLTDTPGAHLRSKNHFCIIDAPPGGYRPNVEGIGKTIATMSGERFGCGENHRDTNAPEALLLDRPVPTDHVVEIVKLDSELLEYTEESLWQKSTVAFLYHLSLISVWRQTKTASRVPR